jgi:DNA-binding NtrC family response regulator
MASILIVEDDRDSADALAKLLRYAGHYVRMARNGKAALAFIVRDAPELVVLDLALPEWGGSEVLAAIRSHLGLKALPVVVWTGMPNSWLARQVCNMGVTAVVPKGRPTFNEILGAVARALPLNAR